MNFYRKTSIVNIYVSPHPSTTSKTSIVNIYVSPHQSTTSKPLNNVQLFSRDVSAGIQLITNALSDEILC